MDQTFSTVSTLTKSIKHRWPVLLIFLISCGSKSENLVTIETEIGSIEIELYPQQAPQTVKAFLSFVDSGFYTNASFYRVLNMDNQPMDAPKSELVQGGLWRTSNRREYLAGIPHETTQQTGILHKAGVVSMARSAPGTATTEFFICMEDDPGLDYWGINNPDKQGYAAFGRVVKGMEVVRKIYRRPENDQRFDPPVMIYKMKR